jgi:hypothetical protein
VEIAHEHTPSALAQYVVRQHVARTRSDDALIIFR